MKIGILGGIGPQSSAIFYKELVEKIAKLKSVRTNTDFPNIILNSIPGKELIDTNINDNDLDEYFTGIELLSNQNVDFIIMICNTIHIYHSNLQERSKVPILNIKNYLGKYINNTNEKVGIIGTYQTLNKLYNFNYKNIVYPSKEEQKILGRIIFNINLKNFDSNDEKDLLKILLNLKNKGCEKIFLGCTELNFIKKYWKGKIIDSIDIFLEMTMDQFK